MPTTHAAARRILFAGSATLVLVLAACGGGGGGTPVQVGANLDFEPTSNVTCQDGFPVQINASFPQPFTSQGAPSCLYVTFFPGAQPPVPGTAVSANIRVGQITGPMRFVRARILYQTGPGQACCSVEEYGQTFTPQPNTITTVPLNFQMTEDHVPAQSDLNTIAANDLVAIEVLAPNVPIPGAWVNNGGAVLTLPNYVWLPAMSTRGLNAPTQNLRSEGSMSGFLPSYNLNYVARGGANNSVTGVE